MRESTQVCQACEEATAASDKTPEMPPAKSCQKQDGRATQVRTEGCGLEESGHPVCVVAGVTKGYSDQSVPP